MLLGRCFCKIAQKLYELCCFCFSAPSTSASEPVIKSTARSGSLVNEDDDDLDLELEGVHLDENIDTTVSVHSIRLEFVYTSIDRFIPL